MNPFIVVPVVAFSLFVTAIGYGFSVDKTPAFPDVPAIEQVSLPTPTPIEQSKPIEHPAYVKPSSPLVVSQPVTEAPKKKKKGGTKKYSNDGSTFDASAYEESHQKLLDTIQAINDAKNAPPKKFKSNITQAPENIPPKRVPYVPFDPVISFPTTKQTTTKAIPGIHP